MECTNILVTSDTTVRRYSRHKNHHTKAISRYMKHIVTLMREISIFRLLFSHTILCCISRDFSRELGSCDCNASILTWEKSFIESNVYFRSCWKLGFFCFSDKDNKLKDIWMSEEKSVKILCWLFAAVGFYIYCKSAFECIVEELAKINTKFCSLAMPINQHRELFILKIKREVG